MHLMTVTGCHNLKLGPVKRSSFKIVKWPRSRQYETIKPAHFGPNFFCLSLVEIEGKAYKNSIKLLKFCDPRSQLFVCELEHFAENQIITNKTWTPCAHARLPDISILLSIHKNASANERLDLDHRFPQRKSRAPPISTQHGEKRTNWMQQQEGLLLFPPGCFIR